MKKYKIVFRSTKKYAPDVDRITYITTSNALNAAAIFKKTFKECKAISCELITEDENEKNEEAIE